MVNCINTLKDFGYSTILLNNNPAAVSPDTGVADTLYRDPITDEDGRNGVLTEKPVSYTHLEVYKRQEQHRAYRLPDLR